MNYQHRFRVQAPLEAVAEFHSHPAAMAAIRSPNPHARPCIALQSEGGEIHFRRVELTPIGK